MVRATLNQTAFTGGEISPRAMARTDIDRYGQALKTARNCHPVVTGGLKMREGSLYVAAAVTNTADASILIPFVEGRDKAWMLELSNNQIKVFNADGTAAGVTLTTTYTTARLADLDWAQSGSTMYFFHPEVQISRLQHFEDGAWAFGVPPFTQLPFGEVGDNNGAAITLSDASVGTGRTVSGGGFFQVSDVGRSIVAGAGIGTITAVGSAISATITITRAFASTSIAGNDWVLEGSPQTTLTPSATGPVGDTITLTAGAAAFYSSLVGTGNIIRINGGLVRLTNFSSSTVVSGVVLRELTAATTAVPALAWSLEFPVWGIKRGFPRTGTVHQQRLIAAGNKAFPRTVWGSRLGEPLDFELGTDDDLAFSFTIDSRESSAISYVTAAKDLLVFTESGEYSMRSGVEKPITPTNVRVVPEKNHGTANVRPVLVGDETLFVQRAGRKVRSIGWRYDFDSYKAPDISALAEHITASGIRWMAYQQEPDLLVWLVRNDGKFLTCTLDRDQQPSVVAWAQHETAGVVECVAAIPNGERDQVWAIVRRTINGATVRYVERFDGTFEPLHPSVTTDGPVYGCTVDCGLVVDNASGQSTFTVAHLANTTVTVVADGSPMGTFTTNGSGQLTLPRTSKRTLIGLPFTSTGTLLTPEIGTGEGSAQGNSARTGEVTMRFLDTIGAKVVDAEGSEQTVPFRTFGEDVLDNAPEPFTGLVRLSKLGWQRGAAELSIVQTQPLPWQLLGVIRKHTVNG